MARSAAAAAAWLAAAGVGVVVVAAVVLTDATAHATPSPSQSPPSPPPPGPPVLTCDELPLSGFKFCDPSLPVADRVADLLPRLNVTQKAGLMGTMASAVPQLGMAQFDMGGEALHGVWSTCVTREDNTTACPTQFPSPNALGASFDRDLWRRVGSVTSTEARGLYGQPGARTLEGTLGLVFYAPNINLMRDPRWGRVEEVPSEDPFLNGEYGVEFTQGMQHGADDAARGADLGYLKVAVTLKHFLAYSLEVDTDVNDTTYGVDRHHFNAIVPERDIYESYLPAFKAGAQRGSAAATMCSYNAVNGVPTCASKYLSDPLRTEWGWDGIVASDCGAIKQIGPPYHNYTNSTAATVAVALKAGVDSDCGSVYPQYVPQALANGTITQQELDTAVSRLLTLRFRLGLWDNASYVPWQALGLESVDTTDHRDMALRAAREAMVLLQNKAIQRDGADAGAVLPIDASTVRSVALVGPGANASRNLLSGYHGSPPFLVSPLAAMQASLGADRVRYARGCNVSDTIETGIPAAVAAAKGADVVVVFLELCGNNYPSDEDHPECARINEAEGTDLTDLSLPGVQLQLLQQVVATGTPTALVMINANPVDLAWAKANVPAIVSAGFPGQYGGQGIADVLLGVVNPGGALTGTWYPGDYVSLVHYNDMTMRAGGIGRTHRFYTGEPLWPFGHGESYTTFELALVEAGPSVVAPNASVPFRVSVANTGTLGGDKVITAYVTAVQQSAVPDPPRQQLFAFERVHVAAGDSEIVSFVLTPDARSLVDKTGKSVTPPGLFRVQVGVPTTGMVSFNVTVTA